MGASWAPCWKRRGQEGLSPLWLTVELEADRKRSQDEKDPKAGAGDWCLRPVSTLWPATGQGRASGSQSLCHTNLSRILGGLNIHVDKPSHFVASLFHDLLSPALSAPSRPHIAHALDLIIHKLEFIHVTQSFLAHSLRSLSSRSCWFTMTFNPLSLQYFYCLSHADPHISPYPGWTCGPSLFFSFHS